MYVHKIGVNGTMCAFSQSVVKPILIYCYSLDSVEYHNIGMIYINAIISAYEKDILQKQHSPVWNKRFIGIWQVTRHFTTEAMEFAEKKDFLQKSSINLAPDDVPARVGDGSAYARGLL